MKRRRSLVILLNLVLLVSGLTGRPLSAAPATETLARVHWLGLNQISADTNSARFMSVWRLPQTAALVAQTLDKFSRCPGHGATNAASAMLRPLLDDLVSSEFYLEISAPTNSLARRSDLPRRSETKTGAETAQPSFTLALRLPADRARLWQTNLADALENLTGVHPLPAGNGWVLSPSNAPARIELSRAGEWTLLGVGSETHDLLSEFSARIARAHASSGVSFWLEADLDPSAILSLSAAGGGEGQTPRPRERERVAEGRVRVEGQTPFDAGEVASFNSQLLGAAKHSEDGSTLNHFHLTATGEAGNVLTRATLNVSRPLESPLPPWEFPTNYIRQPLMSFTAVRGLASWLAASPVWQKLQLAPPPDQAFVWARMDIPIQTYFAAPLPAASNQLSQLAARLVQNANPWLATNGQGFFQWQTNPPGLVWNGAFLLSPFLKPVIVNQRDYALGGLAAFVEGNPNPLPAESLRAIFGTPNLVYFQSEQTGVRIDADLFITQSFRVIFHKSQLPADAAATLWLKKVEPLMGDSTTLVTQSGPEQLRFTRTSTIGLTALEMHLLADWLESPRFPYGLHTFSAPP